MSSGDSQGRSGRALHPLKAGNVFKILVFLIVVGALIFTSIFFLTRRTGRADGPQRTITPAPSPTTTATIVIPTPQQALFYDTFQDNRHNWTVSNSGGFVRSIDNGKLTLSATKPDTTLVEGSPNYLRYTDFSLSVNFVFEQGDANDSMGVYLRGDTNLDHDYRIDINGDATIDVAKEFLDNNAVPQSFFLSAPGHVAALHPMGQLNTLTVIMQGSVISVLLNSIPVCQLMDSDYPSGQIALFAKHGATSPVVSAAFSLFEIDRIQEPETTVTP